MMTAKLSTLITAIKFLYLSAPIELEKLERQLSQDDAKSNDGMATDANEALALAHNTDAGSVFIAGKALLEKVETAEQISHSLLRRIHMIIIKAGESMMQALRTDHWKEISIEARYAIRIYCVINCQYFGWATPCCLQLSVSASICT